MLRTRRLYAAMLIACVIAALSLPSASAADPVQVAVQKAVQWLHTQQLPDGSFGGPNKVPSAAITSDVVYALALAGEKVSGEEWSKGGVSALNALAKMAPGYVGADAGQAGKVARAAAAACANPRAFGGVDAIGVIEKAYDPATGKYHPSFLFRQTLAMEGLQVAGRPVPEKAYEALRTAQQADGSWFWAFGGTTDDVDTTGRVLRVLSIQSQGQNNTVFDRAANYLAQAQGANAAWAVDAPPSSSAVNTNSTALAVGGLRAIGRDLEASPYVKGGRSALQALLSFQEPSGAFVYIAESGKEELRITATTDALMGLLQPKESAGRCPTVYLPVLYVH